MTCLPIIERELRVALRRQRPVASRLRTAALAAGGSVLFLWLGQSAAPQLMGRTLEQLLILLGLVCALRVPLWATGVLCRERRERTLGLLVLADLKPLEVFAAKGLSSALAAFTDLLAILPMLSLPFLLGGLSLESFVASLCLLPTLMVFALALSLLASALTRSEQAALMTAVALSALLCLSPLAIHGAQRLFAPETQPSSWYLPLSPAYGVHLLYVGLKPGSASLSATPFWRAVAGTWGWAAMALAGAAFVLKRHWRDREDENERSRARAHWRAWLHGPREHRQRLAHAWLDTNPFVWLMGRDRQPASLAWLAVGGVLFVWAAGWAAWPTRWISPQNLFLTVASLNLVVGALMRQRAAQEMMRAREEGAYELLLTTPLSAKEIVWGILAALRDQFRPVVHFLLGLQAALMLVGLFSRPWNVRTLGVYLAVWLSLGWWSWSLGHRASGVLQLMWQTLNRSRSNPKPAPQVHTWMVVWMLFNLYNVASLGTPGFFLQAFPVGSILEWTLVVSILSANVFPWLHAKLAGNDSSPLRYADWDPQTGAWRTTRPFIAASALAWEDLLLRNLRRLVSEPANTASENEFSLRELFRPRLRGVARPRPDRLPWHG